MCGDVDLVLLSSRIPYFLANNFPYFFAIN